MFQRKSDTLSRKYETRVREIGSRIPNPNQFKHYWVYKNGEVVLSDVSENDLREFAKQVLRESGRKSILPDWISLNSVLSKNGCILEERNDREGYEASYNETKGQIREAHNEFKRELIRELGLESNPKASRLFDICKQWCSSDFRRTRVMFERFIEIIQ